MQKLTLSLVAQKAGVSKGGLLHHFPNKDQLLDGLFHRELAQLHDEILTTMKNDPVESGRAARAYIGLGNTTAQTETSYLVLRQLLCVMLSDCALSREWTRTYWDTIKSTGLFQDSSPLMLMCCLAADGLFLWEMLGAEKTEGLNTEEFYKLVATITHATDQTTPA
ncbi:MAG: TetR/AcrR family transcriptional regulator [Acetobacter sp.]